MPSVPNARHSANGFSDIQNAQYRGDKLAAEVARADRLSQIDADLEASGKAPWWRRVFRRKPPLPYV